MISESLMHTVHFIEWDSCGVLKAISLCAFGWRSDYLWCCTMVHFKAGGNVVKKDSMIVRVIPFLSLLVCEMH